MATTEATRAGNGAAPKLAAKLAAARKEAEGVEKAGKNTQQGYDYVRAEDVVREAERVLQEQGVIVLPSVESVVSEPRQTAKGGAALMVEAHLLYRVTDSESGQSIELPWIGYGYDTPGDKAIYKAITGAGKYFLAGLLGIPFGADPEDESNGNGGGRSRATAKRREGQGNGKSAQATAPQRRKIHAVASELGLAAHQLKAWIEWNAGTPHTDRIEKAKASELIEALEGYEDATDALAEFNAALEDEDERAVKIATKHSPSAEGGES